jgi:hypothetical protein
VLGGGIKAPFEDVSRDHGGVREQPLPRALRLGADVDQGRASALGLERGGGLESLQAGAGLVQQTGDGGAGFGGQAAAFSMIRTSTGAFSAKARASASVPMFSPQCIGTATRGWIRRAASAASWGVIT